MFQNVKLMCTSVFYDSSIEGDKLHIWQFIKEIAIYGNEKQGNKVSRLNHTAIDAEKCDWFKI